MLKLNIEQQYARLGLNISEPAVQLDIKPPEIQLSTKAAEVEIRQSQGQLKIDSYPCRYSAGFRKTGDATAELAEKGMQAALQAIAKIAGDGNRLGAIQTGETDVIAHMAAESMLEEMPDVVLAHINPPKISYQPGDVEFNAGKGKVSLSLERGSVDLALQRGKVQGYIAQRENVRFWTTEGKYDQRW